MIGIGVCFLLTLLAHQGVSELQEGPDASDSNSAQEFVLDPELAAQLEIYRQERNFDPDETIVDKTKALNEHMKSNGFKNIVLNLSGGLDSSTVLALAHNAMQQDDSPIEFIATIAQPIHSSSWALERAQEAAAKFDVELYVVDSSHVYEQIKLHVGLEIKTKPDGHSTSQLKGILRYPVAVYVLHLVQQERGLTLLLACANKDETGYVRFESLYRDNVQDFPLLVDLHKSEVFAIARKLGVPNSIIDAPPSADFYEGQTDEDTFGFSYDLMELYIGVYDPMTDAEREDAIKSLSDAAQAQIGQVASVRDDSNCLLRVN